MLAAILFLASFPAALDRYVGRWTLVPAKSDEISAVVDRAASQFNFLIRGMARSRLRRTQIAFKSIEIVSGERFRIRHQGGTDVPHRTPNTPVRTAAPDGAQITVRLDPGPPMKEIYESTEGRRENTYVLDGDGSEMTVEVRVTSPRLREPLTYRLVYARAK